MPLLPELPYRGATSRQRLAPRPLLREAPTPTMTTRGKRAEGRGEGDSQNGSPAALVPSGAAAFIPGLSFPCSVGHPVTHPLCVRSSTLSQRGVPGTLTVSKGPGRWETPALPAAHAARVPLPPQTQHLTTQPRGGWRGFHSVPLGSAVR